MSFTAISDPAVLAKEVETGITLVDFWAPWCVPCKALGATIEQQIPAYPNVKFRKVNVDEAHGADLSAQFQILSLPTILLFKDGKMVNRSTGNISASKVRDFIESGM